MNKLKYFGRSSFQTKFNIFKFNKMNFYFQQDTHGAGDPHIVAKRIIKCVGNRLREYDPLRWESVPITYQTVYNDSTSSSNDIALVINIHDAIEKEFNIDIDDRKILLGSIEECVKFIMESHAAI